MAKEFIDRDYNSKKDAPKPSHSGRGAQGNPAPTGSRSRGSRSCPPAPSFFSDRGISTKVAEARPYLRYEKGDPDGLVREAWKDHPRFAAKIAKQASGIIMPRYEAPMRLAHVPAELRPDDGTPTHTGVTVETDSHWHYHGDPLWPDRPTIPTTGKKLPKRWMHKPEEMTRHIERIHDGINIHDVHLDRNMAKYVFVPGEGAKRLDVPPNVMGRLSQNAPRAFVMEGCLKTDAVVSAGWFAYGVPSVTLWRAPEHKHFAGRYLAGEVLYIICDSDWYDNELVITQAMFCRTELRKLGVMAQVAAPPAITGTKVGVDDHLGKGETMSDLIVIDREPKYGLAEFIAERGQWRKDRVIRGAEVLEALAIHAGEDGRISASLRSISRVMGVHKSRVERALRDLEHCGAVTIEGDLQAQYQWKDRKTGRWVNYDWIDRPTIIIAPDLRAETLRKRLGDSRI
jgi:IclR helix-turn-helix domain